MTRIVAQADTAGSFFSMLGPLAIVLIVGSALVFGVAVLRRYLRSDDGEVARDFSLGDLRRLRAEGKITQEELDRAKGAILGKTQAELARPDPAGRKAGEARAEVK